MNFLSPDSKFMYYLGIAGDLIILNVLFILCCIPIVTIGAAQAGLYTALRDILDRDSNKKVSVSFFRGFKTGFCKITVVWTIFLILIALLGGCVYFIYITKLSAKIPAITAIVGICILMVMSSQATLFHSKFDCTKMQLLRNSLFVSLSYPIQSIAIGLLTWLPLIMLIGGTYTFLRMTPIWIGMYYSLAFLINNTLMRKAFDKLTDTQEDVDEEITDTEES